MKTFKEYLEEIFGVEAQQLSNPLIGTKTIEQKIKYAKKMVAKRTQDGKHSSKKYWEEKLQRLMQQPK